MGHEGRFGQLEGEQGRQPREVSWNIQGEEQDRSAEILDVRFLLRLNHKQRDCKSRCHLTDELKGTTYKVKIKGLTQEQYRPHTTLTDWQEMIRPYDLRQTRSDQGRRVIKRCNTICFRTELH